RLLLPSFFSSLLTPPPPSSTLFPYTTLFRSVRPSPAPITFSAIVNPRCSNGHSTTRWHRPRCARPDVWRGSSTGTPRSTTRTHSDRKSTRLNSSHLVISYAVFCLKKKIKLYT